MSTNMIPIGLTVQQWDDYYFRQYLSKNWFKRFMGTGSNAMIQVREDLTKKPGDAITIALINKLKGKAKGENDLLEGNEEEVDARSHKITVREYSHAVKWKKFDEQKTAIDLRQANRDVLMDWNMELDRDNVIDAARSIDGVLYDVATEAQKDAWLANNADRVLFGKNISNNQSNDHSASLAQLDTTDDLMTPAAISLMKRMAKSCSPKIRPYSPRKSPEDGDSFIMFMGSRLLRDLDQSTVFQQANREARDRGITNPIFSAADRIYDGIPIYEIEDIPVMTGVGGSSADVQQAFLCGAQTFAQVWAKRPETVTEDFDFKRRNGLGVIQWYKVEKLRFGTGAEDTSNTKDHGVVTGHFAARADS